MPRLRSILVLLIGMASSFAARLPELREHPCKIGIHNARCGSVAVLENRADPSGRKIDIEFIQVRTAAKDPDPAAWFNVDGGPGMASTPAAAELVRVFGYVLKRRDLVLYDQRGTGGSTALHCSLHDGVSPDEAEDFLPEQGIRRCYQQMAPRADLTKYNTAESAEDLDQLRAALGYDKIVLHGLSYGTRLSQAYMQAHPQHVRAAVLEGALQPGTRISLDFARGMERTLRAILDDCRRDPRCKPVADQIDLRKIVGLRQIPFTSERRALGFTPAQFFEALRTLLYDGDGSRRVPLLLAEVSRGDTSQLARLHRTIHRDNPQFSWPLWLSVTCAEDTPFIRENQVGPATRGTLAGGYRIRQQQRACESWPVPQRDPAVGKPTNIPVLLMEGELDLVTPPWPDGVIKHYFPNGTQVVLPHTGHMPTGLDGLECLDKVEEQFLLRLDNSALDTSCRAGIRRKPFITARQNQE